MSAGRLEELFVDSKIVVSTITKSIMEFERIFAAFVLILLTSLIFLVTSLVYPNSALLLTASKATPWGIFTSIFIHTDLMQLAYNMGGLFLFILLFAICNSEFQLNEKRRIEKYFLSAMFIFPMISNVLWIVFKTKPSGGASGLLYVVEGMLLGFALANGRQLLNFSSAKSQKFSTVIIVLMNVFVAALVLVQILFNPEIFLNAGVGLNVISHGYSFLFGFLASVPWYYVFGKLTMLE